jgi:hypothetical protein
MSTDTVTYPYPFVKGFMGFDTEQEFMRDFTATMRDCGIKGYATDYAEFVKRANRTVGRIEPKSFVPTVVKPSEGGEMPKGGNGNGAVYEGPKDLDYNAHGKKFGKTPGTRSGRGYVHGMSEAQTKYVLFLLNTKDTTELSTKLVRGWTLNPNEIGSISKQHARPFIDALKACPEKRSVSDKKELNGSPRQIEWITKGLNGNASLLSEKGFVSETDISNLYAKHNYSAREIIDALKAMPRKSNAKQSEVKAETKEIELSEGIYSNGSKTFKVYVAQDGSRLFAKELIEESHTESVKVRKGSKERKDVTFTHSWEYVGMAFRFVKASEGFQRVSDSEAARYGQISGTCCRCGRRLVDETSVSNGIGPECAKK